MTSETTARLRPTNIGRLLWLHRTVQRQTVREFAPSLGISIATLSRIERGHVMDLSTWRKIEDWLLRVAKEAESR